MNAWADAPLDAAADMLAADPAAAFSPEMLVRLLAMFALFVASAFFSCSETSLFSLSRFLHRSNYEMRTGGDFKKLKKAYSSGIQLREKTLGIIGLGAIGQQVARIARGIGMKVIAWTRHANILLAQELDIELVQLDDLYRRADVVSLHIRQTPETVNFVGERELNMMKRTALFINTARGPIVDEEALVKALESERIAGAGLDVFSQEPLPEGHPLAALPNVVLTPHSGGVTKEALEAGLQLAVNNVFDFISGDPRNVVAGPK